MVPRAQKKSPAYSLSGAACDPGTHRQLKQGKYIFGAISFRPFRRLLKEASWVVLGQAMVVLGSLLGVRVLTELLEPAAYGELALGLTMATLVGQTVLGPLAGGVMRLYAPAVEQGDLGGYLTAVRRLTVSTSGLVLLLILLGVGVLWVTGRSVWITFALAALIFAVLSGVNSIFNGIHIGARRRSIVALHQAMESWSRFLVAAGLLLWLGSSSTVAMVGYATATVLVLASQYVCIRGTISSTTAATSGGRWQERIWMYSWPLASWGLFTWAQQASDRWALGLLATMEEVGLYAVLFQLGYYPIVMVVDVTIQFFAPILYQRAGDASDSRRNADVATLCWRLSAVAVSLTFVGFLTAFLFHAEIFWLFAATEYAAASHLLPWVTLAGGMFAAGQSISLILMSQMKTHLMVVAKIITAFLAVVLNFALGYQYGATGVVIAGVLFSISHFLWMAMLSRTPEHSRDPR